MDSEAVTEAIAAQEWLKPVEDGLSAAVSGAYEMAGEPGQLVRNFLHGKWLGHALHPAIVEVPVGAWTVSSVLDILDANTSSTRYKAGADMALTIGLVGAVGAALSGLTDWNATDGKPKRVGLAHGLINLGATALFATSLFMRKNGARAQARAVGWAGYGLVMAGAWLGGTLVYEQKIGVDHADRKELTDQFTVAMSAADLPENTLKMVEVNGTRILLIRRGDHISAIGERCSHLGGPLSEGKLEGEIVECPWHGSRFDINTGSAQDGPATFPQPCFEARIVGENIEVRTPPLALPRNQELAYP